MIEPSKILVGVYVNRMNRGQKYLFANISIPEGWLGVGDVQVPADLGQLLNEWYLAYLRERVGVPPSDPEPKAPAPVRR
jgi:hypothetical protein